jgi:hypothetical protein
MHIMIDLETMGTRPNAPIISIGAVAFNAMGVTDQTFYRNVSLKSAVESGAVIDPDTVMWWLRQDKGAQAAFEDGQDEAVDLTQALYDFTQFLCSYGDSLKGVWGNGASFDNVIMHEAGKSYRVPLWEFWKDRCYRTIKNCFPDIKLDRAGVHHNALDDAMYQAHHLIEINKIHNVL